MRDKPPVFELDRRTVKAHFERAAETYDAAAVLQAEVARRLLERLDMVKLSPRKVLDLGAGTGLATADLLARYPKTPIVALDLAINMLRIVGQRGNWRRRASRVAADATLMPFPDGIFDLVCSSLMLQWCQPLDAVLQETARVLAPEGVIMFATLGPDTLRELRESWSVVDQAPHVSVFMDMHDVGDAMIHAGFSNPVVDVETITLTYKAVPELLKDLKALGATNAASGRSSGLGRRGSLAAMMQSYEKFRREDGLLPVTYEVVYGHAWGKATPKTAGVPGEEVRIPVDQLFNRGRLG